MLDSFIGQDKAIEPLRAEIEGTRLASKRLPHMLFLGPPGTGKTTLAKEVAKELFVPFEVLHAPNVDERSVVTDAVRNAQGGVLFIEEVHALKRQFAEDLFTVIDDSEIVEQVEVTERKQAPVVVVYDTGLEDFEMVEADVPSGRTESRRTAITPLTVIGATTDEARLPEAFLSRLSGLVIRLEPYSTDALMDIAKRHIAEEGLVLAETAAIYLAERSRRNPRRLKQLTDRAKTRAWIEGTRVVNHSQAIMALAAIGVDAYGLEEPHRQMLRHLTNPVSRTTLAQKMGIPVGNSDMYFGELVRLGLATIEQKHTITEEGRKAIENG